MNQLKVKKEKRKEEQTISEFVFDYETVSQNLAVKLILNLALPMEKQMTQHELHTFFEWKQPSYISEPFQ